MKPFGFHLPIDDDKHIVLELVDELIVSLNLLTRFCFNLCSSYMNLDRSKYFSTSIVQSECCLVDDRFKLLNTF